MYMYISTPLHEEAIIHYLVFLVEVYNSASYMGGICFLEIDSVSKYCLSLAQLSPNFNLLQTGYWPIYKYMNRLQV